MSETVAALHALAWGILGFGGLGATVGFLCDEAIYRLRARCERGGLSSVDLQRALDR